MFTQRIDKHSKVYLQLQCGRLEKKQKCIEHNKHSSADVNDQILSPLIWCCPYHRIPGILSLKKGSHFFIAIN